MKTEILQIRQTIALLTSMINSGEVHSNTSERFIAEAKRSLDKLESESSSQPSDYEIEQAAKMSELNKTLHFKL